VVQRVVDVDGHLVPVGRGGEPGDEALARIGQSASRREGAGHRAGGADPVQPERALLVGIGVDPRHVPPAGVDDQAVGVQHPVGAPALPVGIADRDRPGAAHRIGQRQQHLGVGRRSPVRPGGRGHGAGHRRQPAPHALRQHPADLRQGRLGGRARCGRTPRQAAGQEAEHDGERLVLVEHERREPVPARQPVATVPAADRLDRHVEVEQVADVAPEGPLVDVQPARQLGCGPGTTRLQELQQRQHPGRRSSHPVIVHRYRAEAVRFRSYGRGITPADLEESVQFVSIRLITADVPGLVAFYERVTGTPATWGNEVFAELRSGSATLAIAGTPTVALFGAGTAEPAANRSVIVEFLDDDVDSRYAELLGSLADVGGEFVNEPTTMPWGNRSLLLRDPDGNLVNLFTPVTPAAREKFGR
jgi:predicted enzyme related to lactoylglutathione lyase